MKQIESIALVLGKTETKSFNRYTFPILGRTVASYVLDAAINADKIQKTYLSTDSVHLTEIAGHYDEITLIPRKGNGGTLTEEVRYALDQIQQDLGYLPGLITLLLANSPCVTNVLIDNVVAILESHSGIDSAVTAMNREEFSPERMFILKPDNHLERQSYQRIPGDPYFLDKRVITTRPETITGIQDHNDYFETLLGQKVYPVIQKEGIWDIDYIWQVPIVERWLKQNGFSETHTPYDHSTRLKPAGAQETAPAQDHRYRILITTVPFGKITNEPIELLESSQGVEYVINPIGRKLKENELAEIIKDFDVLIAGTEPISRKVMEQGNKLKMIARVGIGLDNVDLHAAKELGITVSYTPDGPSPAVAELTIAHMLNLLRHLPTIDRKLRSGIWQRISGERIQHMCVGIIGTGRVGSRVLKHIQGFSPAKILVNDIAPDHDLYKINHAEFAEKETIYREADIITLHIPLTADTRSLISLNEMLKMKRNALLINTSRGGIINEHDLYTALENKTIGGAALDVFEEEPYNGNLVELENCLFSCHMGSMTDDCRARMEKEATEETLRFVQGESLLQAVPEMEYTLQMPRK